MRLYSLTANNIIKQTEPQPRFIYFHGHRSEQKARFLPRVKQEHQRVVANVDRPHLSQI